MKHTFLFRMALYGWRTGLLFGALSAALALTFGSPATLKSALKDSGSYTVAAGQVASVASNRIIERIGGSSINLSEDTVNRAASETFTPQAVETSAGTVIDNAYSWLQGKTATPDLSVDVSGYTDTFTRKLAGQAASQKVEEIADQSQGLPACTEVQLQQLLTQYGADITSLDISSLDLPCSVFGNTSTSAVQQIQQQAAQAVQNDPAVAAQALGGNGGLPQELTPVNARNIAYLPQAYRLAMLAPWIFGTLAIASGLAAWTIAGTGDKREALRRLARSLLFTGIIVVIFGAIARLLTYLLAKPDGPVAGWVSNSFGTAFVKFVSIIEHHFDIVLFIGGAAYIFIAAITIFTIKRRPKPVLDNPNGALDASQAKGQAVSQQAGSENKKTPEGESS